jgi:hypothetical protein
VPGCRRHPLGSIDPEVPVELPARDGGGLESAVRSELGQDVLDVATQGAGRNAHLSCHLGGAPARDNPLQDLHLASCERAEEVLARRRGGVPARKARVFGAEGSSAGRDHAEGGEYRIGLQVLAEESGDAGFLRLRQHRGIVEGGKHHDLHVRMRAPYRPGRIEASAVGHAYLQQAGVGFMRGHGGDAVSGACRYSEYLMTVCLEHGAESLA